jgi:predicted protein tyrosine phosphatase
VGEGAAETWTADPETVVVSITEPGRQARLPKGWADVLRLTFQDYDPTPPMSPAGVILAEGRKIPATAVLFTSTQAAQLSRFARKHRDKNILVHCAAGISRSGAVAEALLAAFPEYEDKGWPRHPNGHVKALMKRALGLVPLGADREPA